MERGRRECRGQRRQRDTSTAADVGDERTLFELCSDPFECRDDAGRESRSRPRPKRPLGEVSALGPVSVVRQSDAGLERLSEVVGDRGVDQRGEHAGREPQAGVLVPVPLRPPVRVRTCRRRSTRSIRRRRCPAAIRAANEGCAACGRRADRPSSVRTRRGRDRAQTVAEMDEKRNALTLLVRPDRQREQRNVVLEVAHGASWKIAGSQHQSLLASTGEFMNRETTESLGPVLPSRGAGRPSATGGMSAGSRPTVTPPIADTTCPSGGSSRAPSGRGRRAHV